MAANAFDQARQQFHDLRGRLTIIMTVVSVVRDIDGDNLTAAQRELLDRLERAAREMAEQIEVTATSILEALALAPASGKIWEVPCLTDTGIDTDMLDRELSVLLEASPSPAPTQVIAIAPAPLLAALRLHLSAHGYQVRLATAPQDLHALLEQRPADLLALAPPPSQSVAWWRTTRMVLRDFPAPILLHLVGGSR